MHTEVIERLLCPDCGAHPLQQATFEQGEDQEIKVGVVWCGSCRSWFPIDNCLLELLAANLAYRADREQFWERYRVELKNLDLESPAFEQDHNRVKEQLLQQNHFDCFAENDTLSYSAYERTPFWTAADQIAFSEWSEAIHDGTWLLDVGCAQGRSAFQLMDHRINVVGLDISKAMIRQAIERTKRERHAARAAFFVGDAANFPFVESCFHYVLVYGVLHHLPNPAETCRQISRVLKPGDIYFGQENNHSSMRFAFNLLQRLLPIWHEEAGAQPTISQKDFRSWLISAGIEVSTRTTVFLPPHLLNLFTARWAHQILRLTDGLFRWIPWVNQQGGLILVKGAKRHSDEA